MKLPIILLTSIVALAATSFTAAAADSQDVMQQKIFGKAKAPTAPPLALTAHALVGGDNTIAVTPGTAAVVQLSSDNATAANRTFTLSATGAVTGAVYILIGPASNQCELADTGIQKLSTTWTPGTTDTLTLLFDGTNFIELARADN